MPYTDNENFNFNPDWLDLCPAGVLVLDDNGRIRWANESIVEMLALAPEHLIGKTRSTLPTHAALFNCESLIKVIPEQGEERWLRCSSTTVEGDDGGIMHLHFYQNSSREVESQKECSELHQKLEALSGTDPMTGLANQHSLLQALDEQVTRSRRYYNPLTIVMLRVEALDVSADSEESELPDETIVEIAHTLRDRLRWADMVGRYDSACFMLILPETSRVSAENLVGDIHNELSSIYLPDGSPVLCRVGYAEWRKGSDPHLLLQTARDTTQSAAND